MSFDSQFQRTPAIMEVGVGRSSHMVAGRRQGDRKYLPSSPLSVPSSSGWAPRPKFPEPSTSPKQRRAGKVMLK